MAFGEPGGFGSNPLRGVPSTVRTRRTTAGSHRIDSKTGGTGFPSGRGRPITDMPKVVAQMRRAADTIPEEIVPRVSEAIKFEVMLQGRPYKLRGHTGAKFPLGATTEKASTGRPGEKSRWVKGIPSGFWRIVEDGTNRHLIAGRHRKGSGNRFTANGALGAFTRGAERGADSFNMGTPVNYLGNSRGSNEGWAQFVDHPGHGPIGHPWARAVARSDKIVEEVHEQYSRATLARAFFR